MVEKVYISFVDSIHKKQFDAFIKTCSESIQKHSPEELHILFSSNGGDINLGLILYSYLKALHVKVVMHGSGNIDSCGINVFLAGEERFAAKGTTFLIHGAKRTYNRDVTLTVEQLYSDFTSLQKDQEKVIANIIDNTSFSLEELKKDIAIGQTLDTQQAQDKGIIQSIKEITIDHGFPFLQINHHNEEKQTP